jgi:hypothetical protein
MKRILMTAAALASLAFAAAPSTTQAATSVGVSIHIGDPYRGGSFHFRSEPDVVLIPGSQVYYVDDYDEYGYDGYDGDLYRYGSWWYLIDDGYWYRARSYRGPFVHVSFRSVPRYVYSVPTRYRRNWGGSYANYGGRWNWYRDSDRRSYTTRNRSYTTRDRNYTTRDRSYTTPTRDRSYTTRNRSQTRDQNVRYRDNVSTPTRDRSTQSRDRSWGDNRTDARRTTDGQRTEVRTQDANGRDQSQVRETRSRGQNESSNRGQGRDKGNKGGNGKGNGRGK